ncbi:MAG: class I SAM-dependent methyltransferase [Pseudobdellovibrionaceae bacterium]
MERHILRQKAPNFVKALQYMGLTLRHSVAKQKLKRVPEPNTLTDQQAHVDDYSRAIQSVMILPYVLILDMVRRLLEKDHGIQALDLCCGPGHFTRMLAKNFDCQQVTGVDLSEPMLQKAKENADKENLSSTLQYLKSDVASLGAIESNSMDLVSFMDGAHHMNSLEQVSQILNEAQRVAKADGVIILLDPVRPKTKKTANLYHRIAGQAYVDRGLVHFNQDFHDSIFASWSPEELFQAIPKETNRKWVQLIPFGFPAFQIIIGLPEGRDKLFVSQGLPPASIVNMIPAEGKSDWSLLKMSFRFAKHKISKGE